MFNNNKVGERIKELVNDHRISDIEKFCSDNKIGTTDFYRWWSNKTLPSVENLIKLANAFSCTMDYAIAREDQNLANIFHEIPLFSERFRLVLFDMKINALQLSKKAKIGRTSIHEWLSGKSKPSLESLIRIAEYFNCTLDYLVGREV